MTRRSEPVADEAVALTEAEAEIARCTRRLEEALDEQTDVRSRVAAYHESARPSAALAERDRLAELETEIAVASAHVAEARVELLQAREPIFERQWNAACEVVAAFERDELAPVQARHRELVGAREDARGRLYDVRQSLTEARRQAATAAR